MNIKGTLMKVYSNFSCLHASRQQRYINKWNLIYLINLKVIWGFTLSKISLSLLLLVSFYWPREHLFIKRQVHVNIKIAREIQQFNNLMYAKNGKQKISNFMKWKTIWVRQHLSKTGQTTYYHHLSINWLFAFKSSFTKFI